MSTVRSDIVIQQGSLYELNVQAKNSDGTVKDLTGYSGKMQVRKTPSDSTVLLEASTANGRITINGPGGVVMISVGADITAALDWSVAYYDLEISTTATNVLRLLQGYATLSKEVTR